MLRGNPLPARRARKGAALVATAALSLLGLGHATAVPIAIDGRVVYVDDGDTVILRAADGGEVNVRLSSIDAPEVSHVKREPGRYGQPFGQASKHFLARLVAHREVHATCFEQDRYGRQDCELFVDGKSVNRELVATGMAWANMAARGRYLRDPAIPKLELDARQARAGLWSDADPIAPWVWRVDCWQHADCAHAE